MLISLNCSMHLFKSSAWQ